MYRVSRKLVRLQQPLRKLNREVFGDMHQNYCKHKFRAYNQLDKKLSNKVNFYIYIKEWVQYLNLIQLNNSLIRSPNDLNIPRA